MAQSKRGMGAFAYEGVVHGLKKAVVRVSRLTPLADCNSRLWLIATPHLWLACVTARTLIGLWSNRMFLSWRGRMCLSCIIVCGVGLLLAGSRGSARLVEGPPS